MVDQRRFDNPPSGHRGAPTDGAWLSAHEAADFLGVQRRTLYAYVARGMLTSTAGPAGRARHYAKDDLERLSARHRARSGHGPVAAGALRWGEPVLPTAITTIDPRRGPIYRGRAATELAGRVPFERAAELLWTGTLPEHADWPARRRPTWLRTSTPRDVSPIAVWATIAAELAVREPALEASTAVTLDRARASIPLLAATATRLDRPWVERALDAPSVAATLLRAYGRAPDRERTRAVDGALVLMADHELNASTFATRVAASTGASLHASILAGLATLSGPRHGAACERVDALLDEVERPARAGRVLRDRLARGETLMGLGHTLYPEGDPRAAVMLGWARAMARSTPRVRLACAVADAADALGARANCDLGLVALAAALGLPRRAASALFAVGRAAGWVAHVLEQRAQGFLIRPRAAPV